MLEADVIIGEHKKLDEKKLTPANQGQTKTATDGGLTDGKIPIMGHPPNTTSDLSLEEFVTAVIAHNDKDENKDSKKGIKLDFKTTEAITKSVAFLKGQNVRDQIKLEISSNIIQKLANFKFSSYY